MMRSYWFITGLLVATFASAESAFVDPPVIVPAHPVAGEIVDVSVRSGVCDAFVERSGYPQIFQDGHSIRIVLASLHYADGAICVYPVTTSVFSVGTFPVGSYTLQVDRTYENYFGEVVVETLGLLPFSVNAAPAVVVSTVDRIGVAALLFSILGLAMIGLRRRIGTVIAVLVVLIPLGVRAQAASDMQAVALLLDSGAPDAPTPQMVVDYYPAASNSGNSRLASVQVQVVAPTWPQM